MAARIELRMMEYVGDRIIDEDFIIDFYIIMHYYRCYLAWDMDADWFMADMIAFDFHFFAIDRSAYRMWIARDMEYDWRMFIDFILIYMADAWLGAYIYCYMSYEWEMTILAIIDMFDADVIWFTIYRAMTYFGTWIFRLAFMERRII